jgi:hypothetical protein
MLGIYGDLCHALVQSARSAREGAQKPIETPFGSFPGKTAKSVVSLILKIFDDLRYVDILIDKRGRAPLSTSELWVSDQICLRSRELMHSDLLIAPFSPR